jgi:hypothetical protein
MNNAITANFKMTVQLIQTTPACDPILLCGDHGLGKSAAVFQAGSGLNIPVYDIRLAGKEPGDIIGLLEYYEDDFGNKLSRHCPPAWWAPFFNPDCEAILFLDEINRAHRDVRQGLFQLILDRELNGNKLPKGVKIAAAINDSEDYDTETLDPAFRSRWRIVNFKPTQKEWLENTNPHPLIYGFINEHQNLLESEKKEVDTVTPDRRAWTHLSDAITELDKREVELSDEDFKSFAGVYVGLSISTVLMQYRKDTMVITGRKVLKNFKDYKKHINFSDVAQLSKIGEEIVEIIKNDEEFTSKPQRTEIKNLISFMVCLPLENVRTLYDSIVRSSIKMVNIFMENQQNNKEFQKVMLKSISKIEV